MRPGIASEEPRRFAMLAGMMIIEKTRGRAKGILVPLLRAQEATGLNPALFSLAVALPVALLLLLPIWVYGTSSENAAELFGSALFFGVSIGILAGFSTPVFNGTANDLESLAPVLPYDSDDRALMRKALLREPPGTIAVQTVIGIAFGLGHSVLLGHHQQAALFILSQATPTILLWVLMFWTVPSLLRNASLFSALGRVAVPDLLRPSRHAAFGAAALRPVLLIVGLLCAYPLLLIFNRSALYGAVLIGVIGSLLSLAILIIVPLWGIRRRIAEQRAETLAVLDGRLDALTESKLVEASATELLELDALLDMRKRVVEAPSWPLDLAGIRRILLYIVLPPVTWAAAALVERVVDTAL